ncbi:MAG: AEC family transporter [Clostridiales bacterium]|nr:AEC family transporter [Clostridiales bacterium]
MLENVVFGLNAILPIFLLAYLGYILRHKNCISEKGFADLNWFCFKIILPVMLFRSVYTSDFEADFDPLMLVYGVGVVLVFSLGLWIICTFVIKDKKKRGSFVQASFRSNYVIMGTAIMDVVYDGGSGMATLMLAIVIPVYTIVSTLVLTTCGSGGKLNLFSILKKTFQNPIIIGILLGLCCNLVKLPMPDFAMTTLGHIANMATPVALLTAGSKIQVGSCINRYSVSSAVLKLLVEPLIFVPAAVFLGLRGEALMALYILFSSPSAITSYSMASNMGCDEHVAADCVFVSTLFSVVTFTIGITILRTFQLI